MQSMTERRWHDIWLEQCEAAETVKLRYGVESAFDYVVGEKLFNFAEAAADHPEFAQALPQFVSRVRGMFTPGGNGRASCAYRTAATRDGSSRPGR